MPISSSSSSSGSKAHNTDIQNADMHADVQGHTQTAGADYTFRINKNTC